MNLTLGLIADYANVSREGKLNILGIFNIIWASKFPAVHPSMHLVVRFEAHSAEAGESRAVKIRLVDADGNHLFDFGGPITIPKGQAGNPIVMDHIIALNQVTFPKPGTYEFSILVDNDHKGEIPVQVLPAPTEQKDAAGPPGA